MYQSTVSWTEPWRRVRQGGALGGVSLADVHVQDGEDVRVALEEGGEGAAGADGGELPWVADEDELRPCPFDTDDETVKVGVRRWQLRRG